MFGKNKRQIENVTFVQPLEGEAYFHTPIAYSTNLPSAKGQQVFKDSDLALVGKLKLIFERENMVWFEVREEKSLEKERVFVMYYFPRRLVTSRAYPYDEKATLRDIKKLFDFIVTEAQTRPAEVQPLQMPSVYPSLSEQYRETDTVPTEIEEPHEETDTVPTEIEEPHEETDTVPTEIEEPHEEDTIVAKQH
jgi:hypothetical protein